MNDPALVKDVKQRLVSAGVEYGFASYVDVHGAPKAKTVPIDKLEKMAAGSELFTVGALEGMGLVGPEKDECAAVPDLTTATIFPWDKRFCWFASDLYFHGEPYVNCPRGMLKRNLAELAARGWILNLGVETEFYIIRNPEDGRPQPLQEVPFKGTCPAYDLYQTTEAVHFLEPVAKLMDELGWGLYSFDQEGGHGQFELDFSYADALAMADRLTFLRLMLKTAARRVGAYATFMPKPFADDFRSGAHFNMSLADASGGDNLFDGKKQSLGRFAAERGIDFPDLAYHFAAGLLEHAGALTAITCPTYNSYQGLIAQGDMPDMSWAPVLRCYGRNNRSAMLRLPMNRYCIENRAPDMSANFYLAAALNARAGLDGIERALDPGEPLNDNLYLYTDKERKQRRVERLPRTLIEALDAFAADPISATTFGAEFVDIYVTQKNREWERHFYHVSDQQRRDMLFYI